MMMKNEHLSAEQQAKLMMMMMMIMMGTLAPTNKQNIEDSQFFFSSLFSGSHTYNYGTLTQTQKKIETIERFVHYVI